MTGNVGYLLTTM